jgi:hypothetical protein
MKIHFEVWMEDIREFVTYRVLRSGSIRRSRRSLVIQTIFWVLFVGGCLALLIESYRPLLFAAPLAGPIAALMYFYINWAASRGVRNSLRENVNELLLGPRSLELNDQELTMRSRYLSSTVDLCAVQKIETTADYTYIYISGSDAYIIPRQDVPEEEHDAFVRALRRAWEPLARDAPAGIRK